MPRKKKNSQRSRENRKAKIEKEIERQENIKEALDYRKLGYTYREIAEQMGCAPSTARTWVDEGLAQIPRESAETVKTMMLEQCDAIMSKLMPLLVEDAPKDIIDSILKVQNQQMKLHGFTGGFTLRLGAGGDDYEAEEVIIARIRADAPVLRPDEVVPKNPVL